MRKSNSIFKTAFVSESGAELTNNDYFAYVEHDDFACYVLASGITDFENSTAAKEAVEHLILSFEEKQSMSSSTLRQYMKEANERLLNSASVHKLEASIIMLVTDYEKFRYVSAGNVRLRMYRQGRFLMSSKDMSLAEDLIEKGKTDTPLDKHEERHNLYAYLGKKDFFRPYVSDVRKLDDSDIITLYTQGFWEHVDSQEIDEIYTDASDNPQESVDMLEEVLLSRQPKNLKSYTVVAIFVNKIFRDPEREHKRQFYKKVAIITLIVIIVLSIIGYIIYRWHSRKVENLETAYQQTFEYLSKDSYKQAQESCSEALKLADDLRDSEKEDDLKNIQTMLEAVIEGEDYFNNENYNSAYDAYKRASIQLSTAPKNVGEFVRNRLDSIEYHLSVEGFITLGDNFLRNDDLEQAEGMYMKAREKADISRSTSDLRKADAALEKLYDLKAKKKEEADKKIADKKQVAMSDALKKGDELLAKGDLEGAQEAYLKARSLSDNPADRQSTTTALERVSDEKTKKDLKEKVSAEALDKAQKEAEAIVKQGDEAFDAQDYLSAQMYYTRAATAYNNLRDLEKVKILENKSDVANAKYLESRGKKIQAEDTEMMAREYYADKNFEQAKKSAQQAKTLYLENGDKNKADEMDALLQQIAVDETIAEALN